MPDLPSGTVTFLFTDVEGSTRLLHSLGPEAYAEAVLVLSMAADAARFLDRDEAAVDRRLHVQGLIQNTGQEDAGISRRSVFRVPRSPAHRQPSPAPSSWIPRTLKP